MKYLLSVLLCTLSFQSFAYSECVREVKHVFNDFNSNETLWVNFTDGGSAISKRGDQISEARMNRFFSMAITAKVSGKKLRVRYPEADLQCPPPSGPARNDVIGIWLVD